MLNFVVEFLRGGLELLLDSLGVQLQQSNISLRRQIQLEVHLVEFEQLHHIAQILH